MTDRNKFLETVTELGEEMAKARNKYEKQNEEWWNNLTQEEREDAFYAVCKRIWQADGVDRGSYRHGLYHVFGFDAGMYGRGMDCGYMSIHNAIFDGEQLQKMHGVNRVEVIDRHGRSYTNRLEQGENVKFSLQDDDKTLKVFIDSEKGGL